MFVWLFAACQFEEEATSGVLAIGDSIMEWNIDEEASIPEVTAQALGLEVRNASISGTQLTDGWETIPEQYVEGSWDWVILDGGANDLNDQCGCGDCDSVLDEISSEDGSVGVLPELVDRISSDGHNIIVLGYYDIPEESEDFAGCDPVIVELNLRKQQIAESRDGVWFVSARDVVQPDRLEMYDEDLLHPSVEGSRVIGEHIADFIQGLDAE